MKCIIPFLPILQACSSMYIPSAKNMPLFANKGEAQVEAGVSTNSIYATGSYAFSEKYALIANGSLSYRNFSNYYDIFWESDETSSFLRESEFAHRYAEVGLGRYNLLPLSTWRLECFAGGGYGVASDLDQSYKSSYYLGFLQGNIGKRKSFFEFGWSFRLAFSGFQFSYPSPDTYNVIDHKDFNNLHFETLASIKLGRGPLQGFFRGGLGYAVTLQSLSGLDLHRGIYSGDYWRYTVAHISVGMSYRF